MTGGRTRWFNTSSNLLYTAHGTASLKGLTFVPQATANAVELMPGPVLTAQTGASVNNTFTVTNTPADAAWHSAITGITVNGSTLPTAAYNITQSGKIVFDPTQSVLLQGSGSRNIVVSATGYSATSVQESIVGVTPPNLSDVSISGSDVIFSFTSTPALSFTVYGTTNLALPLSQWQNMGHATEGSAGQYQFTAPGVTANPAFYYTVSQP